MMLICHNLSAKNLILVAIGLLIKIAKGNDHSSNVQFCASLHCKKQGNTVGSRLSNSDVILNARLSIPLQQRKAHRPLTSKAHRPVSSRSILGRKEIMSKDSRLGNSRRVALLQHESGQL